MKKLNPASMRVFAFGSLVLLIAASCGGPTTETTATPESEEPEEPEVKIENAAACIWDNVAVRETPTDKGKYITAISIGEIVTFMEEKDSADKYIKVQLNDGTEGWARKDFVIPNATSYVFINDTDTYSRPDALTKTGKKFSKYDIIAVISTKDDFAEIKGKRSDGKWIETAWVKISNLSRQKVDIASAKFINKTLADPDDEVKAKGLEDILNNSDLSGSVFLSDLPEIINTLRGMVHEDAGDYEEDDYEEDVAADSTSGN